MNQSSPAVKSPHKPPTPGACQADTSATEFRDPPLGFRSSNRMPNILCRRDLLDREDADESRYRQILAALGVRGSGGNEVGGATVRIGLKRPPQKGNRRLSHLPHA